ncbi:orotidine-5'-phosphate decarboxylase [Psychroflexus aestuariivivens]|uniref:orotidine-5'-phosphate decarboxylase n=1 Tax=Psychroflexus aestuariivivens TaxID=1795040 RepID=UPI000FD72B93|nr:orotidine-5'-phosphate decarboxylase [Psychroflexus aestuariivivens]
MQIENLIAQIKAKQSLLCIGLDVDLDKIPKYLLTTEDPIFEFNKAIIDSTAEYCVAYKPNIAFYEAYGLKGWQALEKTISYLNTNYPDHYTIADAKRGDIGNTSRMYAKAFLEDLDFDSITIAPYMGKDSVEPFLQFENKHAILLALTSNEGANDFQLKTQGEYKLFEQVLKTSQTWQNSHRLMYVVGATQTQFLKDIRALVPKSFLLVPGVGAQGGSLKDVCQYGLNEDYGLLINASRAIIYASDKKDFAQSAADQAKKMQEEMKTFI